tara:strand:- start:3669 stop:3959 length:291 start_codon:yes stop_codon:yes gene_type:complete
MAFSQVILDISKETKQTRNIILERNDMQYIDVQEVNKALETIGKYLSGETMSVIERALEQGVQDHYDNQIQKVVDRDTQALNITKVDIEAFDENPF